MNKLIFVLLIPLSSFCQEFINSSSFESKTAKGISVIEFWAEWNKSNEVSFLGSLKDCSVYRVCIVKGASIKNKYNISTIPTLIIFDNGNEVKRFNPNIMMQLASNKKDVQSEIDKIILNKFQ